MAYLIYLYFFDNGTDFGIVAFILSEWREYDPFEELDLELFRGLSFYFLALLLKKLNVLSIYLLIVWMAASKNKVNIKLN